MEMTKPEIQEKMTYHQAMIHAQHERLYALKIQEARQGFDTPAHIVSEIKSIAIQINEHEAEINRLKKLTIEGQLSLAEAEYCLVFAEIWSLSQGQLTAIDRARLDVAMKKLGIDSQDAKELEHEIRSKLTRESILKI